MIVLTGSAGCTELRECIADRQRQQKNDIGFLFGMKSYCAKYLEMGTPVAFDNDNFGAHLRGATNWWEEQGERLWLRMLDKILGSCDPLFVLLPDVVANWGATLERAHRYQGEVKTRDLPIAVALQDGCDLEDVLALAPDYVFVGGTTRWKWTQLPAIVKFAARHNIKVHVGRTGGRNRIRECLRLGVDSCDSTGFAKFWNIDMNWLPHELDNCDQQTCFDQMYLPLGWMKPKAVAL